MSYRILEHKHHHHPKHRGVAAMSSLSTIDIVNGQRARIAYPCWYIETSVPKRINPQPPQTRDELIKLWERCIYWDQANRWCCHPTWHHCHHEHCQKCKHYLDMSKVIPIHLNEEYRYKQSGAQYHYPTVTINFEKDSSSQLVLPGLSASCSIGDSPEDIKNDYIVRANIYANCQSAQTEKQECRFTLVLQNDNPDGIINDVIANGLIRVWPAIL